jgi:hypothetical protein
MAASVSAGSLRPIQRDVGARAAERFGDGAPEAGVRTRDRRDAAPQFERWRPSAQHVHGHPGDVLVSWFSPPIAQMKL